MIDLSSRRLHRGPMFSMLLGAALTVGPLGSAFAAGAPVLWGAGVTGCSDFLATAPADPTAQAIAGEGYRRYQEWLSGLVTGLNLATGRDVLKGAELDAAMIRIRANCERYPNDDFFNAAMRLVRSLGDPNAN
ncbi:hypothetical protein [Thiocapsa marina]|uniref:Uncharacterized protein n=1 Tax=Thiocapsa marina 5811 TaxID=768671 RepID=F9U883_9GAMM|nr:hypothetical protein [Thiocapsa marina]EGV19495.1 hypothetical protein ThimaDRAFT_0941 [Thiocapsa marina 5811]